MAMIEDMDIDLDVYVNVGWLNTSRSRLPDESLS
jgi:hypothetical protein